MDAFLNQHAARAQGHGKWSALRADMQADARTAKGRFDDVVRLGGEALSARVVCAIGFRAAQPCRVRPVQKRELIVQRHKNIM